MTGMAPTYFNKIVFQCADCFGRTWNVTQSIPTEHGWNLLAGYPVLNGAPIQGIKGPPKTILTPELCAYLETFRMKRGKVRLPLGSTSICKLRRQLGMNYWNDCKKWWEETGSSDLFASSSQSSDSILKPGNLTWTRDEIRQVRELLESGTGMSEIARLVGKKEKAVFHLRQRLYGRKRRFWTTQEQEKFLEAVQNKVPRAIIAEKLGRSLSSINHRLVMARKMGLVHL